jgi:hypothetical protein
MAYLPPPFSPGSHILHPQRLLRSHNYSATTLMPSLLSTMPFTPTLFLTFGHLFLLVPYIVGYCPCYDLHHYLLLYITFALIQMPRTLPPMLMPLLIVYPPPLIPISYNLRLSPSLRSLWIVTHFLPHHSSTLIRDFPPFSTTSSQLMPSQTPLFARRHFCRYPFTILILFLSTHILVLPLLIRPSSSCIHVLTSCPLIPLFPLALETGLSSAALDAILSKTHITFLFTALLLTTYAVNARLPYGPRPCTLSARLLYHPLFSLMSPMLSVHFSGMTRLGRRDNLAITWDFYPPFIPHISLRGHLRQNPNVYSCVSPTAVILLPSGLLHASGALSAASTHRVVALPRGTRGLVDTSLAHRPSLRDPHRDHAPMVKRLTFRITFFTYYGVDINIGAFSSVCLYLTLFLSVWHLFTSQRGGVRVCYLSCCLL